MSKSAKTPPSTQEIVTTKVTEAYASARDGAAAAVKEVSSGLTANPVAALLGGIALGAAAGALLPRGDKEKALLAPLGERLAEAASAAIAAGRDAGTQALGESGFNVEGLREQVGKLFGQAGQAASAVGAAAFTAARDSVTS